MIYLFQKDGLLYMNTEKPPVKPPLYFTHYVVDGKSYETGQSAWKAYETALSAYKDKSLLCADQEEARKLIPKVQYQIMKEDGMNLWENVTEEVFMKYNYRKGFDYRRTVKEGEFYPIDCQFEQVEQFQDLHGKWINAQFSPVGAISYRKTAILSKRVETPKKDKLDTPRVELNVPYGDLGNKKVVEQSNEKPDSAYETPINYSKYYLNNKEVSKEEYQNFLHSGEISGSLEGKGESLTQKLQQSLIESNNEVVRLEKFIKEVFQENFLAVELCKSVITVCQRKGADTNWEAWEKRCRLAISQPVSKEYEARDKRQYNSQEWFPVTTYEAELKPLQNYEYRLKVSTPTSEQESQESMWDEIDQSARFSSGPPTMFVRSKFFLTRKSKSE